MSKTSKSDQLRALREAKAEKRPPKAAIRGRTIPLGPKVIEGLKQAVEHAQGKRMLKTTKVLVKRLTSHPDCPVCNARRERTREAMRARRAK